ncbi:MAG: tetraacyldisaccharide 4'-kinase [Bacteroidales bacterium]|nr:tetraacyldisaccharide 4'-kinase [Bacteroidales bacterium]
MFKFLLKPISWIYGMVVAIRNFLYDNKVLKSHEFEIPVISVGNIAVGGTGKTPHTEYIVNLLKDLYNVTILSRGYKRKTKGYIKATNESTVAEIGDEPKQMSIKFKDQANVCVCENRCKGIKNILKERNEKQVVILDDAYQHRRVTPRLSILLTDYNKPFYEDSMLPYGNLREPSSRYNRANIIIVTKCPDNLKPIDRRVISKHINLLPFQSIYFTNFKYLEIKPVFSEQTQTEINKDTEILLITGIANPTTLIQHIQNKYSQKITHIKFADHHNFSKRDINKITEKFVSLSQNKVVITTEKDAVRLMEQNFEPTIKEKMYYIPIEINFVFDDADKLNSQIIKYVEENKTNYRLHTTVHQF